MIDLDYFIFGLPSKEIDRIKKYLKTYNADRYLPEYANKKIKKVVIQAGMDKTATTSIQLFLSRNTSWIHQKSIEYKTDWGANNHSVPLKSIFSNRPECIPWHIFSNHNKKNIKDFNIKNLLALCKGIKECKQETYVFFGEGICSFSVAELKNFKRLIRIVMPDAKIDFLYCVRSNSGYASSGYQQAVKSGRYYNNEDIVKRYSKIYFKRIIRAMLVIGKENMLLYRFEDTLKHEFGPVGFFLEKIGAETRGLNEIEIIRENDSISFQATEIIEFINRQQPLIVNGLKSTFRNKDDTDAIQNIHGQKYSLNDDLISKIIKSAAKDLLWLDDKWGITFDQQSKTSKIVNIVYDEVYIQEFVVAFNNSNEYIKSNLINFVLEKIKNSKNKRDNDIFVRLREEINTK